MKCPYCKKEMISGLSSSRGYLSFQADDAPMRLGIFPEKLKVINESSIGWKSEYCKDCNKIIIDLEDENKE